MAFINIKNSLEAKALSILHGTDQIRQADSGTIAIHQNKAILTGGEIRDRVTTIKPVLLLIIRGKAIKNRICAIPKGDHITTAKDNRVLIISGQRIGFRRADNIVYARLDKSPDQESLLKTPLISGVFIHLCQ